ncbi:alpha/beta fold hydrolase [Spirulina subsalsa]|uniref:alpha/beta fold hydrolase n=1 Tax=Spirulina subsalsa TaxID=54311 RepID=UPI0002D3FD48|nr:alpha/beta hydrolase [Spirulina subsalsa]
MQFETSLSYRETGSTETGRVNLGGVDHFYQWIRSPGGVGETPIGKKPVIVFVHGWGGSARYWESTARAICQDFDCLLYDLRGFARSPLPKTGLESLGGYELGDYAQDLGLLLDHFGLERVYLNGHSLGASIAALFAGQFPQRVERLILTCNGIFEYNALSFKTFHFVGGYVVKFRFPWFLSVPLAGRLFMARFLHRPLPDVISREFLEDYLMADEAAAVGTIYTAVSEQAALEMPQVFANLAVPTLLVSGEKDIIIPPQLGRNAAALNGRIEYLEIPQTAHFPMLEDGEAYLRGIRAFLRGD